MNAGELVVTTAAELLSKRASLLANREAITTLAIGSSHGDYAFDPAFCPGSFNFCSVSQDLKHSAVFYEFGRKNAPNIRNVVLFYSVFSPGFYLEKVSEKLRCAVIKELFETGANYSDVEINAVYERVHGALDTVPYEPRDFGYLRSNDRYFFPASADAAAKRAADHAKHNARGDAEIYLLKILDMARSSGHAVTVVLSPIRPDFWALFPQGISQLFRGIVEIKNNFDYEFNVLNLIDHPDLLDEYFGDYDHLLPLGKGPEVVSTMVDQLLRATD